MYLSWITMKRIIFFQEESILKFTFNLCKYTVFRKMHNFFLIKN